MVFKSDRKQGRSICFGFLDFYPQITAKINGAGKFLDIQVLDHIIITNEGYFSFADEGLL